MVIKVKKPGNEYGLLSADTRLNASNQGWFCALIFAIAPILQHYRGPVENAGYTALLFALPAVMLMFLNTCRNKAIHTYQIKRITPLLLFEAYCFFSRAIGVSRIFYIGFMIFLLIAISACCINMKWFLIFTTSIIRIALILLVIQYISRYLFAHTIDLRPLNLLVDQDAIWIRHTLRASSNTSGLYRPAAFFLEPSHLFLYSFPVLCLLLLSPGMTKWRLNRSIEVSIALLLSTSGFAIVLCVLVWTLYLLIYQNENADTRINIRKIFSGKTFIIIMLLAVGIIGAYLFIPIFQRAVNRIVVGSNNSNAISGRVRLASNYIRSISGKAVLFGTAGITSSLEFNLAGFFATYIKWGVIGLVLTYWYYAQGLFALKREYFWITLVIIVISFFTAHTHGTFYMIYYVTYLSNGYTLQRTK